MTQIPPSPNSSATWHALDSQEALRRLHASPAGLTPEQVEAVRQKVGFNELPSAKKDSVIILFLRQFFSVLMVALIIAAIVSAVMGKAIEAIAIMVIVILAAVVGFIQEHKAEQALEALRKMAVPLASVLRNGIEMLIPAREVVPGDILLLKTGDAIAADARLTESANLSVDESMLTGESRAAEKESSQVLPEKTELGDRVNMLYSGTSVQYGRGVAVVTGTGLSTEIGKIASLLQTTTQRETPLQTTLDVLGRNLGIFSLAIAVLMSLLGIAKGHGIAEMFIWGVAIAVAVIPEALPAVMTITLALGVRRMVAQKALIRKLQAVETLGATSVICSDKTGTLTQNEMTVTKVVTVDRVIDVSGIGYAPVGEFTVDGKVITEVDPGIHELLRSAVLCNDAVLRLREEGGRWEMLGDPTEGALLVTAAKRGLNLAATRSEFPRVREIPFSSERKQMTSIHRDGKELLICSKGAAEVLLIRCDRVFTTNGVVRFDADMRARVTQQALQLASDGLRVLGFAMERHPGDFAGDPEEKMVFLGLTAMLDPVRPEVKDAIRVCEKAGIRPVMITGDHRLTAYAIGKELGILKHGGVVTGHELSEMSDQELELKVQDTDIFARIAPEHKLRIVNAFMNRGHVVAMTGDGVNDAPALKRADIGVAMGISGTDVSKQAADMILTDDNFASIVSAVKEGRSIFLNIRKYLVFLLSGNMGTVLALMIALFEELPLPLMAVQVLFINFIMDGLIAISLGVEPPEPGIMNRPPRSLKEGMLNWYAMVSIGVLGVAIGLATLTTYQFALDVWHYSNREAMSLFFATLITARLVNAINSRSLTESAFNLKRKGNPTLMVGMVVTALLTAAVLFVPAMHEPFQTVPLTLRDLGAALLAGAAVLVVAEILKAFGRYYIRLKRKRGSLRPA
jgi:P-type Ca2+ transporter type 2C